MGQSIRYMIWVDLKVGHGAGVVKSSSRRDLGWMHVLSKACGLGADWIWLTGPRWGIGCGTLGRSWDLGGCSKSELARSWHKLYTANWACRLNVVQADWGHLVGRGPGLLCRIKIKQFKDLCCIFLFACFLLTGSIGTRDYWVWAMQQLNGIFQILHSLESTEYDILDTIGSKNF